MGMASTIDQISSAALSRREAITRAARQRIVQVPDRPIRSRQVGYIVIDRVLTRPEQTSGFAAYARQAEQYTRWKEAAGSHPVRRVELASNTLPAAKGTHLDLRL